MALGGSAKTDIKLEAVNVYWGTERCESVTLVDDVAGSLDSEYWDLNTIGSDLETETQYVVWLDNGSSVDPSGSKTGIQVTYTNGDDAATIAGLVQTAIDAVANVTATVSGAVVTYENDYIGKLTDEDFTNATALTFSELVAGKGGALGATAQGGSTLNMEAQSVDLVSDQTGSIIAGQVYTGSSATVDMSLIEMTKDRWETVVGSVTGDVFTPTGGTRLVGYGESRLYQNLFDLGGKLILHPIRLDNSDRSEDVCFFRSAPLPSSVSYSGQDIQGMEVSFVAYNDKSKPEEISLFAQGDWSQELV
jgi:hypothetical protein